MPTPSYKELYDNAVIEGRYADAATIKGLMETREDIRWSPGTASGVELMCLLYSCLWGYTSLRHRYAPYNESQSRWRKHLFFLGRRVPLAVKGAGAFIALRFVLRGVMVETVGHNGRADAP
jgi:hypothetical protein